MSLAAVPIDFETACTFVEAHHRHHMPPAGWKFGVGAIHGGKLVGVATVGRPVARGLDDGLTLEVTRNCTDGTKNAASFLYGRCVKAAVAMGYRRVITYTLISEVGTSLRAVKAIRLYETKGGSWDTPSRRRKDVAPLDKKVCWQLAPAVEVA